MTDYETEEQAYKQLVQLCEKHGELRSMYSPEWTLRSHGFFELAERQFFTKRLAKAEKSAAALPPPKPHPPVLVPQVQVQAPPHKHKRRAPTIASASTTIASATPTIASAPRQLTFEQRWAALEAHADTVSQSDWPQTKAIASLATKASELDLHRLTARDFAQLLEDALRRQRPSAAPVEPGSIFLVQRTPWVVDGVFRHGLNLLVGQPGAGKSKLISACLAAWLRGDQTWLNREMPCDLPVEERHALIIGTDQGLEDWAITLEPVGLVSRESEVYVRTHPRLKLHPLETGTSLGPDGLATIRRWCDQHPGGAVVVDSLAACLPPGIDEDKSGAARPVHALGEALGTCWGIVTHHTRKGAGKEQNLGVGAGRGSGAIDGAVSRVIGLGLIHKIESGILVPQEADPRRELLSTKRGGATMHLVIRLHASGFWSNEGSADDLKRQERRERTISNLTEKQSAVISALEDAAGWLTGRQVAEALLEPGEQYEAGGSHAATTRKTLRRLEVLGLVETMRVGLDRLYRAADQQDQPGESRGDELNKTGSNGSNTAAQGISLAHPLAHPGSKWLSPEPGPAAVEQREPVRTTYEPPLEPVKPVAPQSVSHKSQSDRIPCTVKGQPGWSRRAGPVRGPSVVVIHADGRQLSAAPKDVVDVPA